MDLFFAAARWQTSPSCHAQEVLPPRDACDLYEQRRSLADSACAVLKSATFSGESKTSSLPKLTAQLQK